MAKEKKRDRLEELDKLIESIRELRKSIRELRKSQKKTDEQIRELRESQKETSEQIRQLRESQKKTDEQMKETDRRMKETDRRIGKLTDAQGLFWESLSEEGIKNFLNNRGYTLKRVLRHVEVKKDAETEAEFDIIFETEKDSKREIFIAEVKATVHPSYVDEFVSNLKRIFEFFPEYQGKKIWGIYSSGRYADGTEIYAQRMGLLVFGVKGDVLKLLNPKSEIKPFFDGSV